MRKSACQVAVDAAAPGYYTYSVPEGMDLSVGQMVLVEFGRRELVGYVMELKDREEGLPYALKPVKEILKPDPLFGEDFTRLVSFVSSYYIYPEGLAVKEILPCGIAPKLEKIVVLTPAGAELEPDHFEGDGLAFKLLKNAYPAGLAVKQLSQPSEVRLVKGLLQKKLAFYRWEIVSKGVGFTFEWIISRSARTPEKVRLGKNEADLLKRLEDAPPTPLSHFRIFYKDALRIARSLNGKGLVDMVKSELSRDDPLRAIKLPQGEVRELTRDQAGALAEISRAVNEERQAGFLLFGVTGSGKTEVYLRAAALALEKGKSVLWLAPEIALTLGLEARIKAALPGLRMSILHSALSPGERHDHWLNLERGVSRLALGARSAVFAPMRDLGLVIVDEEHDWAYKQEDGLRYNGRDLALWRAKLSRAVIILGSATPSLESYQGAASGRLALLAMTTRPEGATLPRVLLVDRKTAPRGSRVLAPELKRELSGAFARGEQALLFINRRGHSSVPVCLSCGESLKCPYCSLTLTLHGGGDLPHPEAECGELGGISGGTLICHGCGYRSKEVAVCPSCGSGIVRYMGVGTEKLLELVEKEFGVKGLRLDADSTRRKGGAKEILEAFGRREADFLVGTQMAAKGHDFANLTVVGVVDADIGLHLPDFRASERVFQLLSQVSGRAGRAEKPGTVVIQTLNPAHYALTAAGANDYPSFSRNELEIRESLRLPPFGRLALLRFSGPDEEEVSRISAKAREALETLAEKGGKDEYEILGPAPSPINKLKDRYRYQIMFRSVTVTGRHRVLAAFLAPFRKFIAGKGAQMSVDVDPYHLM
ncbi:MAG: primosomal protein N' [Deltaproteobacteria bacterium]|jgi:primosomal protein N' (replication factor Y)|nr:primosomal protein N' [Deltaproteobacteria bacterium]